MYFSIALGIHRVLMSYTPRWIEHLRDYMVGNIHLILTWRVGSFY